MEKIVAGRLASFYKEVCLAEQRFVMDDAVSVGDLVKKAGPTVKLQGFVRLERGDGVAKEEKK